MSEFRQDATNGRWAIIAPDRGKRPHAGKAAGKRERVDVDPACPFCPGNEGMLPPIIEETPSADAVGWLTRVVPNKYPILSDADGPPTDPLASGYGHHEVIVETPQHDADLPDLPEQDMAALVETWHRRYCAALALPGIRSVQLFRNHGREQARRRAIPIRSSSPCPSCRRASHRRWHGRADATKTSRHVRPARNWTAKWKRAHGWSSLRNASPCWRLSRPAVLSNNGSCLAATGPASRRPTRRSAPHSPRCSRVPCAGWHRPPAPRHAMSCSNPERCRTTRNGQRTGASGSFPISPRPEDSN